MNGLFDLSNSSGANESERLLIKLCNSSFLSLWAHPNTFTSEGKREGQSSGKEFTDVLVVFGEDVILFSDKHINYDETIDPQIAWRRWHKRAVVKSANQLKGAKSWIQRFPDEIYLDAACTRRLPVEIPKKDSIRFHLIATTRGTSKACVNKFGSRSGTLLINSSLDLEDSSLDFQIGVQRETDKFVHVFDEDALDFAMKCLTTAPDFIEYLNARKELLCKAPSIICEGEETLLATFLSQDRVFDSDRWATPTTEPQLIHLGGGIADDYFNSKEYASKIEADQESYLWDQMIEDFIKIGNPSYGKYEPIPNESIEYALRTMASENRLRRRTLTQAFKGLMQTAKSKPFQAVSRAAKMEDQPRKAYVFSAFPRHPAWSQDEYRERRRNYMTAYTSTVQVRFPDALQILALGVDHPIRDYDEHSEDLIVVETEPLTEQMLGELQKRADDFGFHRKESVMHYSSIKEYPAAEPTPTSKSRQQRRADERAALKKSRL